VALHLPDSHASIVVVVDDFEEDPEPIVNALVSVLVTPG
jgi:hypothetical protein